MNKKIITIFLLGCITSSFIIGSSNQRSREEEREEESLNIDFSSLTLRPIPLQQSSRDRSIIPLLNSLGITINDRILEESFNSGLLYDVLEQLPPLTVNLIRNMYDNARRNTKNSSKRFTLSTPSASSASAESESADADDADNQYQYIFSLTTIECLALIGINIDQETFIQAIKSAMNENRLDILLLTLPNTLEGLIINIVTDLRLEIFI